MTQKDIFGVWHCPECKSLGLIVETGKCCAVARLVRLDQETDTFAALPALLRYKIAA